MHVLDRDPIKAAIRTALFQRNDSDIVRGEAWEAGDGLIDEIGDHARGESYLKGATGRLENAFPQLDYFQ